jgi:hypothetical protein
MSQPSTEHTKRTGGLALASAIHAVSPYVLFQLSSEVQSRSGPAPATLAIVLAIFAGVAYWSWPIWVFVLWSYRRSSVWAFYIPITFGAVVLLPVLHIAFFFTLVMLGGRVG